MNSSKVKTQKTLSALLAIALAFVTLFQAATANSSEVAKDEASSLEAELIADIDNMFADESLEMELEEEIYFEEVQETTEEVKVYDSNNELIGKGNPASNPLLNKLVLTADYLSEIGGQKYYKITE